jgi:hypothetical protein
MTPPPAVRHAEHAKRRLNAVFARRGRARRASNCNRRAIGAESRTIPDESPVLIGLAA